MKRHIWDELVIATDEGVAHVYIVGSNNYYADVNKEYRRII